uniref:Uncharacterized protein n=1 Tax=Anopheles atroparvus TaxID=41427 RepID=A0A182ITZ9_ANOAO
MLARTAADNFRVMPNNLRVLATLGVCGERRKLYRFVLLLAFAFAVIIFPKPVRITDRHPFESIVRSVAEFNFAMLCFLTIIIMASKSEPLRQVVHKMEQTLAPYRYRTTVRWTKPAESEMNNSALFSRAAVRDSDDDDDRCRRLIIEVNDKIHRFSVAYAKLNVCNMLLFNLVPPACNFPRYLLHRNVSNRTTVEFLLPLEQDFYRLDIRHNVAHYTVFCASIIPACCLTTLIFWTKGILFILIRNNTLLYQFVNRRLEEYHRPPTGSDGPVAMASLRTTAKTRKVAEIVELHYASIECNQLLDSIYYSI